LGYIGAPFWIDDLRQAEIENLQVSVRGAGVTGVRNKLPGLIIAVYDAPVVRCRQGFRELNSETLNLLRRQRAFFQALTQRTSRNQLHGQKVHSVLGTEFENRSDVGVIQLGEGQRFLAKLLSRCVVSERAGREDLQRDVAIELLVVGTIDFAHAASADLCDDAIVRDALSDQRGGIWRFALMPSQRRME
jgi:hypothetical protein